VRGRQADRRPVRASRRPATGRNRPRSDGDGARSGIRAVRGGPHGPGRQRSRRRQRVRLRSFQFHSRAHPRPRASARGNRPRAEARWKIHVHGALRELPRLPPRAARLRRQGAIPPGAGRAQRPPALLVPGSMARGARRARIDREHDEAVPDARGDAPLGVTAQGHLGSALGRPPGTGEPSGCVLVVARKDGAGPGSA
jgi:hypothetical protein